VISSSSIQSRFLAPLLLVACISTTTKCSAAPIDPQLYWAISSTKIQRANLDGSNVTQVMSGPPGSIGDIVVDRRFGHIYWTESGVVNRSTLDGQDITALFTLPQNGFGAGIAIDPRHNHLFFVDGNHSAIYRSDLDGSNAIDIVPTDGISSNRNRIFRLSLDPNAEKLYWTQIDQNSFRTSNLDGSQIETLFTVRDSILDFQVDPLGQKLYWTTFSYVAGRGSVKRANLDGTQQETLVSGLWGVYALALDVNAGKMYFADSWSSGNYDSTIRMANLDGTDVQTILNLGPQDRIIAATLDTLIVPEPSAALMLMAVALCSVRMRRRPRRGPLPSYQSCRNNLKQPENRVR
jgi:sugar lactone lactonase YvrE